MSNGSGNTVSECSHWRGVSKKTHAWQRQQVTAWARGPCVHVTTFLDFAQCHLIFWFIPSDASSHHLGLIGLCKIGLTPYLELPFASVADRGRSEAAIRLHLQLTGAGALPALAETSPASAPLAFGGAALLTWRSCRSCWRRENMHPAATPGPLPTQGRAPPAA